jgi:hypothetical protein
LINFEKDIDNFQNFDNLDSKLESKNETIIELLKDEDSLLLKLKGKFFLKKRINNF